MKIGIDLRCLVEGNKTGVEEYALNLLENVLELDRENEYVIFFNYFRNQKINLEAFQKYPNVKIKKFGFPNKILNLFFWYLRWPQIDQLIGRVDVLFFPNINFASWSPKTKTIITVHDLSFEHYPETFSLKRRLWHFLVNPRKLIQKTDKIIAVSDSTKNDLIELYQIEASKIKMIHSAVTENFSVLDRNSLKMMEIRNKYKLPYKFILFLGTIEPRKNIIGLVRAYNQMRQLNDPELEKYKLVIAGSKGWKYKKIISEIKNSPFREDIIIAGRIEEEDLPTIYNLASLFVYPSFFEGFGFPPLEAMRCGVPVIVSNNSSLPEIVGEGAIMIDPDKPDEILEAMKAVILSKELKTKICQKGIEQAKKFGWEKAAHSFLETVRSLV